MILISMEKGGHERFKEGQGAGGRRIKILRSQRTYDTLPEFFL